MSHTARIALFACASLALGSGIALSVPTDMKPARNSELDRLSESAKIVRYPGEDRVVEGANSYPIVYSPQWLAVAEAAERERMAKWGMADAAQPIGYDQPDPAQEMAEAREAEAAQRSVGVKVIEPQRAMAANTSAADAGMDVDRGGSDHELADADSPAT